MLTLKDEFLSKDLSMQLMQVGYPQEGPTYYLDENFYNEWHHTIGEMLSHLRYRTKVAAPLRSMACDWLRTEKGVHIETRIKKDGGFTIVIIDLENNAVIKVKKNDFATRHEALDRGINIACNFIQTRGYAY